MTATRPVWPERNVDVDDFGDGRKLGVLPLDAPAEGFRYQKDVFAIVPFAALPENGNIKNVIFEWTIQLRTSPDVGAPVMFEQRVKLPVQFIGMFGFAFWSPLNQLIEVETSIVNGRAVELGPYPGSRDPSDPQTHFQGWKYVDATRPTEYSEQGLPDFDFSDTSSFNSVGALVNIRYYSAAYKQNAAPGWIFDAVRDTAGIGRLDKEATYQVSFKKQPGEGYWLDSNSQVFFARPNSIAGSSGIEIHERVARRGNPLGSLRARAFVPGLQQPHLCKTDDGTLWLLCRDRGRVGLLYRSGDDGLNFQRATLKSDGAESDVVMFGEGYNLLDIKPAPTGGTYQLAEKDGVMYLQKHPQPFAQNRTVGVMRTGAVYKLGVLSGKGSDGTIRIESAAHAFVSGDEFNSAPLEIEA
jgi:hypothetical protein